MSERKKPKKRSGGPHSAAGKAASSKNAIKHGGRSMVKILPWESQADYDRIEQGWRGEFEPEGFAEERLVKNLIWNDWLLERTQWLVMEAEIAASAEGWTTEEQWHQLELKLRYKTTAERAFYRAWEALRALRKDDMKQKRDMIRLEQKNAELEKALRKANAPAAVGEKTAGQLLFQGQNHPKKMRKIEVLDQWVEVEIEAGKTVTTLFPSNEKLIELGKARLPPPELVYRRMNFRDGVPEEYYWTTKDEQTRKYGGHGVQRMTTDTWLEVIEREKLRTDGHIGPTGVGNLPRPKERGGCDCPVCSTNREIMEQRAKAG
jgi:hypothetical protein